MKEVLNESLVIHLRRLSAQDIWLEYCPDCAELIRLGFVERDPVDVTAIHITPKGQAYRNLLGDN
jgi:hypothetical protein